MTMHYIVIFGSFPHCSFAELFATTHGTVRIEHLLQGDCALVSASSDEEVIRLFQLLGGSVKLAKAILTDRSEDTLVEDLTSLLLSQPSASLSRLVFGLSYCGQSRRSNRWIKGMGIAVKKQLRQRGNASRVVVPQQGVSLSSVVVRGNHLLTQGREYILVEQEGRWMIASTIAVQEVEEWVRGDVGRPRRNAKRGMLPPKLARMMINLSGHSTLNIPHLTLLDPFCGSGTVLAQALELGYRVIGSDLSELAVGDTRKNLEWLMKNKELRIKDYELLTSDVRDLLKKLPMRSIDAIVTEPDLGPPQIRFLRSANDVELIRSTPSDLYRSSLNVFSRLVKPGGRVVMSLPVWRLQHSDKAREPSGGLVYAMDSFDIVDQYDFKIVHPLPPQYYAIHNRPTLLYGRLDQFVWREIIIVEKV